jgi:hypothetical protein
MKRFLRRTIFCLVPAALVAFVGGVPATALDLGLQNVNLSCSDGTNLGLALDLATVPQLTDAVSAINLNPAGDPALSCSLARSTTNPNGPKDFAVGGGRFFNYFISCEENFAVNSHAPDDVTGPDTAQGTGNLSIPAAPGCSPSFTGDLVTKVDCQIVSGTKADFTSEVTKATGIFPSIGINVGDEIAWEVRDMDPAQDEIFANKVGSHATSECNFGVAATAATFSIDRGNISVHDN